MAGLLRSGDPIITYAGQNVTADWLPALLSLTWRRSVGNASSKNADSISISLADPTGHFRFNYNLAVKQPLKVQIESWNWNYPGEHLLSDSGEMDITRVEIEQSKDRGSVIMLTASSIPPTTHFRLTKKSRSAVQTDLKTLAADVAKNNGWKLDYQSSTNPPIKYAEQHDQSDAAFLLRFCHEHDLYFRVKNKTTLIVGSMQDLEARPSVGTIVCPTPNFPGGINGRGLISWRLVHDVEDTYQNALVQSKDKKTGKNASGFAEDADQVKDGGGPAHNVPKHPITGPVVEPGTGAVTESK
jgi:hypothetical protein